MKSTVLYILSIILFSPFFVCASTTIDGTRVIYNEGKNEVLVKVNNVGSSPVLIQSWIDDGNMAAEPGSISVPFVITPPINRVNANKSQSLRVKYSGGLPEDKESVFWVNILEVPTEEKVKENYLQVAFRSRIKLFYRPKALKSENVLQRARELVWSVQAGKLYVKNSSPLNINVLSIKKSKGRAIESDMVPPFYDGPATMLTGTLGEVFKGEPLVYSFINDWGGIIHVETIAK